MSQNDKQMAKHRRTIRKVMRLREGCAKNKDETIMEQESVRMSQEAVRNNKNNGSGAKGNTRQCSMSERVHRGNKGAKE